MSGLSASDAEEHVAEHEHRNHAALFVGLTTGGEESQLGREENALTLGLDYERRLNRRFGAGVLIDVVIGGERREGVAAVPLFVHAGRSTFVLAAGVEFTKEHRDHDEGAQGLIRLGYIFSFHVDDLTIAPTIDLDIVDDEQLVVFGVNIGRGF